MPLLPTMVFCVRLAEVQARITRHVRDHADVAFQELVASQDLLIQQLDRLLQGESVILGHGPWPAECTTPYHCDGFLQVLVKVLGDSTVL